MFTITHTIKNWIIVGLAALCLVLAGTIWLYKLRTDALSFALSTQNEAIKRQNTEATTRYKVLETETKITQARLDAAYEKQEKTDAQAIKDIEAAGLAARREPVRVRVQCASGSSRGSAASRGTAPGKAGAGDADTFTGVLEESAAIRFEQSVTKIEQLQAAFNSCKATQK